MSREEKLLLFLIHVKKPSYVYKERCILSLNHYKIREAYLTSCQKSTMLFFAKKKLTALTEQLFLQQAPS